jgi:hypothetical protein
VCRSSNLGTPTQRKTFGLAQHTTIIACAAGPCPKISLIGSCLFAAERVLVHRYGGIALPCLAYQHNVSRPIYPSPRPQHPPAPATSTNGCSPTSQTESSRIFHSRQCRARPDSRRISFIFYVAPSSPRDQGCTSRTASFHPGHPEPHITTVLDPSPPRVSRLHHRKHHLQSTFAPTNAAS